MFDETRFLSPQSVCAKPVLADTRRSAGQMLRDYIKMRLHPVVIALFISLLIPVAAQADDPNDPAMRNAAARARDKEITRRNNLNEHARTTARDARYAEERRVSDRAQVDYAAARAQHERDMAAWRRAVAACRSGNHAACAR